MAFTEQKNEMIRKDLLDEALRCAVTVGMRKTSVEQLTEAVGIAKGSFYKVFPSKELLFFAVLENIHAETYAVAEKALQDNAELPPTERATKIILAACKYLSDTKAMTFIENDAEFLLRRIPSDINLPTITMTKFIFVKFWKQVDLCRKAEWIWLPPPSEG